MVEGWVGGEVVRGDWLEGRCCGETVEGRIICGRRWRLIVWKELGWKGKVSTIEELGRGDVGNSSRGGANTEEDPREMMKPVGGSAGFESIFEAAMETFNQPI